MSTAPALRWLALAFTRTLLSATLLLAAGCASHWPTAVEANLAKAGRNRAELERALRQYEQGNEPLKLRAAQFLIANMDGHGFAQMAMFDAQKHEIPYNALAYPDAHAARAALDALEAEHGKLETDRKHFDTDLQTISAELLTENIDLAFQAWHERPWARNMPFDTFCELVLPYRGGKEPLCSTRLACLARYAALPSQMKDPTDPREAGRLIQQDVENWIRFNEIFYYRPTEQSFDEMRQREQGRCGDISNMLLYAMRANAVPVACDYTPLWANRDNNHAWTVLLDEHGVGKTPLSYIPAKVYRKTFSKQDDTLAARAQPDEKLPYWLKRWTFADVTDQYVPTTDVTVQITQPRPAGARFAYVCVFNDGEWGAVHGGEIQGDHVTFTKMGRSAAYLPAYYVDEKIVPAAAPFILTTTGEVRPLTGPNPSSATLTLTATAPKGLYDASEATQPPTVLEPGRRYALFVWDNGWTALGERLAGSGSVTFENVPAGRLYWLLSNGSQKLERIFTVEDGKQVWW